MICERCHSNIKDLIHSDTDTRKPKRTFGEILAAAREHEAREDEALDEAFVCQHHQTFGEFVESVARGCYLCCKLDLHLRNQQQLTDLEPFFAGRQFRCKTKRRLDFGDQAPLYDFELVVGSDDMFESALDYSLYPYDEGKAIIQPQNAASKITRTSDDEILVIICQWLEQCKSLHRKCLRLCHSGSFYPKHLLDLQPHGLSHGYWRLCRTSEDTVSGPYVTLSHRWGIPEPTKLTRVVEASMRKGLPLSSLTQVFQDAARVTLLLGARYLWVDSVCIYQDPDRLDIQVEASRMADIYGNALCNLSALTANSKSIFVERNNYVCTPSARVLPDELYHLGRDMVIEDPETWPREVLTSPLARRGWVLQEQVLAPRTIYFGQDQLLWSCPSTAMCETYPQGGQLGEPWISIYTQFFEFTRSLTLVARTEEHAEIEKLYARIGAMDKPEGSRRRLESKLSNNVPQEQTILEEVRHAWRELVEAYSARNLTEHSDKLLAIGGVVYRFQTLFRDEYMAGLWRRQFPENLLWIVIWGWEGNMELQCPYRPEVYTAPTWSWASINGAIEFEESEFIHRYPLAHLQDVHIEPLHGNPYGTLKSANLQIKGPLLPIQQDIKRKWTFEADCENRIADTIVVPQFDEQGDVFDSHPRAYNGNDASSSDLRCSYYALFLTAAIDTYRREDDDSFLLEGLVLRRLGQSSATEQATSSGDLQAFARCGTFRTMLPFSSLSQKPIWMPQDWQLWLPDDTPETVEARAKARKTFSPTNMDFLSDINLR